MKNFLKKKKKLQKEHLELFKKNYELQKRLMDFLKLEEKKDAFLCGIQWENPYWVMVYYINNIDNRIETENVCITKEGMFYKPEYMDGHVLTSEGVWWDLYKKEN